MSVALGIEPGCLLDDNDDVLMRACLERFIAEQQDG